MRGLRWEVVGIEPDYEAARVVQDNSGLQVYRGILEEAGFVEGSFDVVTINHMIEHVTDTVGLFEECRRILKPGGCLVVVTPNSRSLGRQFFDSA